MLVLLYCCLFQVVTCLSLTEEHCPAVGILHHPHKVPLRTSFRDSHYKSEFMGKFKRAEAYAGIVVIASASATLKSIHRSPGRLSSGSSRLLFVSHSRRKSVGFTRAVTPNPSRNHYEKNSP